MSLREPDELSCPGLLVSQAGGSLPSEFNIELRSVFVIIPSPSLSSKEKRSLVS